MDLIYDPFDEREAITSDGRMAGKVFVLPASDGKPPTAAALKAARFVGHTDFSGLATDINAKSGDL